MTQSSLTSADWFAQLRSNGYAVLSGVFGDAETTALTHDLVQSLAAPVDADSIRSREGSIYAARNILQLWPPVRVLWQRSDLLEVLHRVLGPEVGLVRVLFFDKPPERTWALPWHKDLTIAIRQHRCSEHFRKPTCKAGVPHVEAPLDLLQAMLTLRIHLDAVTEENGPLRVIPGSHLTGKAMEFDETNAQSVHVGRGDVLLMRPLLVHGSAASHPESRRHRRILHLEFSGREKLPDGFEWHDFVQGA